MLERALGLVIDLEVPLAGVPELWQRACAPKPARVAVPVDGVHAGHRQGRLPTRRRDGLRRHRWHAASVRPDQYDVVELDVDGGAEKILDFSYNLARLGLGDATTSIDTPDNYGLPALRSAGFSIARVEPATRLVSTFDTASSQQR